MSAFELIKKNKSFKRMTILLLIGWLFLVVASSLLLTLEVRERHAYEVERLEMHYSDLFTHYNEKMHLMNAYFTDLSMDVDTSEFTSFVEGVLEDDPSIHTISIAQNGIVSAVYPEGYSELIGYNIMENADVYESSLLIEAIENNTYVYHYVIEENQVKEFIVRSPIIVDGEYYGFLSLVVTDEEFGSDFFMFESEILNTAIYTDDHYISGSDIDINHSNVIELTVGETELLLYESYSSSFLLIQVSYVIGFVLLLSMIFYLVMMYHYRSEKATEEFSEELEHLRNYDAVTGVYNVDRLFIDMNQLIDKNDPFYVCFIIINNMKMINEKLGYDGTNQFLKTTINLMQRVLRNNSQLYRYGGDEYVLVSQTDSSSEIKNLLRRITKIFESDISSQNVRARLGITVGITSYPNNGIKSEQLIHNANLTAQAVKGYDKEKFRFYRQDEIIDRVYIEDFDKKVSELDLELLEVYLMPIVDVNSNLIQGFECLTRVFDEHGNRLDTEEIILSLERTGRIQKLDEIVFRKMLRIMKRLNKEFKEDEYFLSVNASALSLNDEYVEHVIQYYKDAKLRKGQIVLELTESYQVEDYDYLIELFNKLNANGIKIAIDDFGSGYSSISYISKFPIYAIKVDKQYVRDYQTNQFNQTLFKTLKSIAEVLDCRLVAEGVDRVETLDFLKENGCKYYQGFYFSKGVSTEETLDLIRQNLEKYKG